ncbi:hypothetical protein CAEBREN_13356 [Caenorhabditis brenneri]|uniref:Uncharacterized protein n=1 Tax=Caenorhabditis brenneri TaxID=135651 RepID=G0P8L7_CAEBE|nr:hypothetical protein CAEBREN_13356 [Caenorhabditis brenneri]
MFSGYNILISTFGVAWIVFETLIESTSSHGEYISQRPSNYLSSPTLKMNIFIVVIVFFFVAGRSVEGQMSFDGPPSSPKKFHFVSP